MNFIIKILQWILSKSNKSYTFKDGYSYRFNCTFCGHGHDLPKFDCPVCGRPGELDVYDERGHNL